MDDRGSADGPFTQAEVCGMLRISPKVLLAEIAAGNLTHYWVGRRRRFDRSDIEAFKRRQRAAAAREADALRAGKTGTPTSVLTSAPRLTDFMEARARRLADRAAAKKPKRT